MSGAAADWELQAARNPGTYPQLLADIAARRWDLHSVIAANPSAYPELRRWIAEVNPGSVQPQQFSYQGSTTRRPGGAGWWFAGCGCLSVIIVIAIVAVIVFGSNLSSQGGGATVEQNGSSSQAPPGNSEVSEQLDRFESERAQYYELARVLDGNPVAPLVTDVTLLHRLEDRATDPNLGLIQIQSIADQAQQLREELEQEIADAEARRLHASGSLPERLINDETNGFVETVWDAASACGEAAEGKMRMGCVTGGSPRAIHLRPDNEYLSDWERQMVVTHELAHVYVNADNWAAEDHIGFAEDLLALGEFQGSEEILADCYSLTYYDEWELNEGNGALGYGYVCNAAERQLIRDWASAINAPMPG